MTHAPDAPASITVLFLGANPSDTTRLGLGEEVRLIQERLRGARGGQSFELRQAWAVRREDLQRELMERRLTIVHFSGHGVARNGAAAGGAGPTRDLTEGPDDEKAPATSALMVEDEHGKAVPVSPAALADLFRILGQDVRCVVLNACYSAAQAEALSRHVDVVVGMTRAIGDSAAIAFAGAFYQALGYGQSVQAAFELGKNQLQLEGMADVDVPKLTTRAGVDASQVRFVAAEGGGAPAGGGAAGTRVVATATPARPAERPAATPARPAERPAAPAARTMRWLHLSDLHLGSEDGYGHDIVLQALVTAFRDGGLLAERRPDVVFCTGDVANGGKKEQYGAAGRFFEELARATGVPLERTFVVPGNHDLDRARVSKAFVLPLADREAADAFFGPEGVEDREIAFRRFSAFAEFHRDRFSLPLSAARPFLLTRCRVGGEVVGVIGLNTAWLAHQDEAQGKLVVGERLVRQAIAELDAADEPATVKVALLHHPLDWLRDFEREAVRGLLLENVDYILHGHLHAQRPEVVKGPEGDAVLLAAGAAYQGRKWPASALLVELAANEARVEAICFREMGRGIWMPDPILAPRSGGVFRIPRQLAAVAAATEEPPSAQGADLDTSTWLRRLENETRWADLLGITTGGDALRIRLEHVFIPLRAQVHGGEGGQGDMRERVSAEMLVAALGREPFLAIVGDPGSGKTTLLRYVAHHRARALQGHADARVALGVGEAGELAMPLLVQLKHIAGMLPERGNDPLVEDLDEAIVAWAEKDRVGLPASYMRSALRERQVALLLDGLDEIPDPAHRRRVLAAVSKAAEYLATQRGPGGIVVTSRPAAYGGATRLGPPFVEARVLDFGKAEVERFLDRWIRAARGLPFEGGIEGYPDAVRQYEELRTAIATSPNLEALARTPVLLTAIALVHHHRHRLPAQRAVLYDEAVGVLLRRFEHDPQHKPAAVRAHLAAVAWRMMEGSTSERLCEEEHEEVVTEVVARRIAGLAAEAAAEEIPREAREEARRLLDKQALMAGLLRVGTGSGAGSRTGRCRSTWRGGGWRTGRRARFMGCSRRTWARRAGGRRCG